MRRVSNSPTSKTKKLKGDIPDFVQCIYSICCTCICAQIYLFSNLTEFTFLLPMFRQTEVLSAFWHVRLRAMICCALPIHTPWIRMRWFSERPFQTNQDTPLCVYQWVVKVIQIYIYGPQVCVGVWVGIHDMDMCSLSKKMKEKAIMLMATTWYRWWHYRWLSKVMFPYICMCGHNNSAIVSSSVTEVRHTRAHFALSFCQLVIYTVVIFLHRKTLLLRANDIPNVCNHIVNMINLTAMLPIGTSIQSHFSFLSGVDRRLAPNGHAACMVTFIVESIK